MLRSMAIRMKEWGLLAYPRQSVHLPLNALNDWGRTGRVLGQGVQELGSGVASLLPAIQRITQAGSQADTVTRLREIGAETTEELLDLPVKDWDYSWEQAYAPRVQQLLNELSGEEREQAAQLSEVYGRRFSLDGRRRLELQRIQQARGHWQQQVDDAVQRGDEDAALHWVEQGRELFVPEQEVPQQQELVRNRCMQSRWQQRLQQEPYSALADWQHEQTQKPTGEQELGELEESVEKTRRNLFSNLAAKLAQTVELGQEPDARELERAVAAGVLSPEQLSNSTQERESLKVNDVCNWLRRIDERDIADDEKLVVDIALAPVPAEDRRLLLQRMQATAAIPQELRRGVSQELWNLYNEGSLGCPGDVEALFCLGGLQEEALCRMSRGQEDEIRKWLQQLRQEMENWFCFEK